GASAAPVAVNAQQTTTVTGAGPATPQMAKMRTVTFVLDAGRDAVVVNAASESAGVRDNEIVRYIPGSTVARQGGKVVVNLPGNEDGAFATIVAPAGSATQVQIAADLKSPDGGPVSAVTDQRSIDNGVARTGVSVIGNTVVLTSATTITAQPLAVNPPPAPTPFNPLGVVQSSPLAIGPAGPAGVAGVPGAPGPQGPPGPAGSTGPLGAPGASGASGATGANGTNGAPGAIGTPGATGPAGAPGPTGAFGAKGAGGPAGTTGATGDTGPLGPTGAAGVAGPAGAIGPTGAQGIAGPAGATGATGDTGPVGPTGAVGSVGATGSAGTQGP